MNTPPELVPYRLSEMDRKLDKILTQVERTNGRMDKAEDDIIRLQERTNPWTASGIASGLGIVAYMVWERLRQ